MAAQGGELSHPGSPWGLQEAGGDSQAEPEAGRGGAWAQARWASSRPRVGACLPASVGFPSILGDGSGLSHPRRLQGLFRIK